MILRSPTDNENAWERFLASARNDNACHLERSERSFSNPIFEGGVCLEDQFPALVERADTGELRMLDVFELRVIARR